MITLFNFQFVGREDQAVARLAATAAQRRAQQRVFDTVEAFLRGAPQPSGESAIQDYMREGLA
eukprot:4592295-Lingulodinium_polyedra.AAC.1